MTTDSPDELRRFRPSMTNPAMPRARSETPTTLIAQLESDCTALVRRVQDRLDVISDTVISGMGLAHASGGPSVRVVCCERAEV